MKNVMFSKQTVTSLVVFLVLVYVLFNTNDFITRVVVIPFIVFSLGLFLKNIFLMLKKEKFAKVMEKIYVIAFFLYYFGFLVCFDYVSFVNKDYMSLVVSLIAWIGGILICYKRFRKLK